MLYNAQILADHGLEYPETYEEFQEAGTVLAADGIKIFNVAGEDPSALILHNFDVTESGKTGLWFICEIFSDPNQVTEDPQYAPRRVIISESEITGNRRGGVWKIASDVYVVDSTFENREQDLMLYKSTPEFEDTVFRHEPFVADTLTQVPQF